MSKSSKNFYSVAVNHPELPGAYLASFGIPGHPPEWVMEGRSQKIFIRPEEAENAGYRMMMARLNRSSSEQKVLMKNETRIRVNVPDKSSATVIQKIESRNDADRVFSNFKSSK